MNSKEKSEDKLVSLKLHQYLCKEVVGTEKAVNYRRLYYKLMDSIYSDAEWTAISSGSKAEGLVLPGSDVDVMACCDKVPVYECKPPYTRYKGQFFLLKSDNAQPGFVHILVPSEFLPYKPFTVNTEYGLLISNRDFKTYWLDRYFKRVRDCVTVHGPCISTIDESTDIAFCFRCSSWPSVAKHWLARYRPNQWPHEELVSTIASHGILLVPIGSKTAGEGNPLEWRISFSEPEKLLIYSFNHTQLLCYALLKITLKQIINESSTNNILCSYFMKTVMFWISEEIPLHRWTPTNLLPRFWDCIDRVLYWLKHDYIPNYFIPEHNMIAGKTSEESRMNLVLMLQYLKCVGLESIVNCESLCNFWIHCKDTRSLSSTDEFLEFEKSILPRLLVDAIASNDEYIDDGIVRCFKLLSADIKLPKRLQKMVVIFIAKLNFRFIYLIDHLHCKNKSTIRLKNNKAIHELYNRNITQMLIGTNIDSASGWVSLAMVFYCTKQYHKCLEIICYISSLLSSDTTNTLKPVYLTNITNMDRHLKDFSFFKRLRFGLLKENNYSFLDNILFDNDDIKPPLYDGSCYTWSPTVMAHYLQFMCCVRLNLRIDKTNELRKLMKTIYYVQTHMTKHNLTVFKDCFTLYTITLLEQIASVVHDDNVQRLIDIMIIRCALLNNYV